MIRSSLRAVRSSAVLLAALAAAACAGPSAGGGSRDAPALEGATGADAEAERPRLVQAGAPGEETRPFDAASLEAVEGVEHTQADVAFMQGMIHHHAQALVMTALIPDRTDNDAIRQMGLRMEISQADEIGLMERWLERRGEPVPEWRHMLEGAREARAGHDDAGGHGGHAGHGGAGDADASTPMMPGMLTPEQMDRLRNARDGEFDRLFLEYMIQHHEGAVVMVRELFATPGAGQESRVFHFASEVDADQTIEIRRMREVLQSLR